MQELLEWFEKEQRPLPWRKDYDPYSVWISEVMLQQTQVTTMLPYFQRWMLALPNLQALASAPEDQVLKLWEGLGYYSRALNLKKAAIVLVEQHGGDLPRDHDTLLTLPGIGPYTAAAISSIAFQQDRAVVDGNGIRVLSRLTGDSESTKINSQRFWTLAQKLLPPGKARDYNQALMELGALICSPKKPQCGSCPLQKKCPGLTEQIPNLGKRQEKEKIQVSIAVLRRGSEVFIQKRPPTGLMAGLWEFPGGKVEHGESPEEALRRELQEELDVQVGSLEHLLTIPHAYTRFQVQLHCFSAEFKGEIPHLKSAVEGRWVPVHELGKFAFPAANLRLIEFLSVLC